MRGYNYSTTVTVDVDVDIDENDLSDEDLREICDKRGILSGGLPGEVIEALFVLFKQGKHDQVLERVRQVVQDAKGVVL